MNRRYVPFFLLLFMLFYTSIAHAQEINTGVNFQVVLPQNEFSESINTNGLGVNLFGIYNFPESPFGLGLDFNFINFGKDTRDEPLSSTIPDLRVRVENEYNLIQGLILSRVKLSDGIFQPYAEGLAGVNYFYTQTSIENRRNQGDEPIATDTNFEDWAFAWGGGAGLMIRVFDRRNSATYNSENPLAAGFINAGLRYLNGSEAEYLKEGSIVINNGNVTYETLQSTTDMLMLQIGFVVQF